MMKTKSNKNKKNNLFSKNSVENDDLREALRRFNNKKEKTISAKVLRKSLGFK